MILHLGGDEAVYSKDIVMIMDVQTAGQAPHTRRFLSQMEQQGRMVLLDEGVKSYVVVAHEREDARVYASPISAATLAKRCAERKIGL